MQSHKLSPEKALLNKEWQEINRWAWFFRKISGESLEIAINMKVPNRLKEEVLFRTRQIQAKHGLTE
jgi:hypothetical protein